MKKTSHSTTRVFLLLIALVTAAATSWAHSFAAGGIYYRITYNNNVQVTNNNNSSNSYSGSVTIPSTVTYQGTTYSVTGIDSKAFSGSNQLTSVSIPSSVTSISYEAFYYCTSLTSLVIPNSVTSIGTSAFQGCSALKSITLSNSITSIAQKLCCGCSSLTSVTIPSSVTSIGNQAFAYCKALKNITTGSSVKYIYSQAFAYCDALERATITASVTSINPEVFTSCPALSTITVQSGNTTFDSRNSCNAIIKTADNRLVLACKSTTIPGSVTAIGKHAFYYINNLTSITIPSSVASIEEYAIAGCKDLAAITVASGNTTYDSRNGCNAIIHTATNSLVAGCKNTVIPAGITAIGNGAFYGSTDLTSIVIPSTVTSIGNQAFYKCSHLASITIPNSVFKIGAQAFDGTQWYNTTWNNNSPDGVVYAGLVAYSYNYETLPTGGTITLRNGTISIASRAFHNADMRGITMPNSVTYIGDHAFEECYELEQVVLSQGLTAIPTGAFKECYNLSSVNSPASCNAIGDSAFSYCGALTSIVIGNSVTRIGKAAFYNCTQLANVTFGQAVETIGELAFFYCPLSHLVLPDRLKKIEWAAFAGCDGFTELIIPDQVTKIGTYAFGGCHSLTTLTIPNSVDTIGSWAFFLSDLPGGEGMPPAPTVVPSMRSSNPLCKLSDIYTRITDPSRVYLGPEVFNDVSTEDCVLHIPAGTTSAYQAADQWRDFLHMAEGDTVYIQSLELECENDQLMVGETTRIFARILPADASFQTLTWVSSDTCVASVDPRGVVTARGKGAATITATTGDGTNLSATCDIQVTGPDTDNYFTMQGGEVLHGRTLVIPVTLHNVEDITAFQADLWLPEGFQLVRQGGQYLVTLSDRATSDHVIMASDANNGAVRLLCYSSQLKPIADHDGELLYLTVQVPDEAVGDYTINLKGTRMTTTDCEELVSIDAECNIHVLPYLEGDANNSGDVTVTDIVTTALYILNRNPYPFNMDAADMTHDGKITVTDVVLITRAVLSAN